MQLDAPKKNTADRLQSTESDLFDDDDDMMYVDAVGCELSLFTLAEERGTQLDGCAHSRIRKRDRGRRVCDAVQLDAVLVDDTSCFAGTRNGKYDCEPPSRAQLDENESYRGLAAVRRLQRMVLCSWMRCTRRTRTREPRRAGAKRNTAGRSRCSKKGGRSRLPSREERLRPGRRRIRDGEARLVDDVERPDRVLVLHHYRSSASVNSERRDGATYHMRC